MVDLSRRTLLKASAAAGAVPAVLGGAPAQAAAALGIRPQAAAETQKGHDPVPIRWLEDGVPAAIAGTTFGVPWPKGALPGDQTFSLTASDGSAVPVQTWPTAWWPDGSLKWSAHAVSGAAARTDEYTLATGKPEKPATSISVKETSGVITVDTGTLAVSFPRNGGSVVGAISRGGSVIAKDGRLIASAQDAPSGDGPEKPKTTRYECKVDEAVVEQDGPVRAVVKVTGTHKHGKRSWLPFTLRFSLFAGSDAIRLVHTFVFDGDENADFINGIGVEFRVPMSGEQHNRHVRLAGAGDGVLGEAVRPITGLRRDPGQAAKDAQIAGTATPDPSTWDTRVTERLHWIPTWGDYRLTQLDANGFRIAKRTGEGASWIRADEGTRSAGLGYVGTPFGGLAFGMKDFWQLHPTELEIAGADTDEATARVWMWSPRAGSMDLRFYHDGLGQDTYEKQLDALNITYEDYEPGFGTPYGVARTTELTFWALGATPTNEQFAALAGATAVPPLLRSSPQHNHAAGVFGSWAPVDRSTPGRTKIEDRLDKIHAYHREQVDQRSWYGFWDYGDVMHEYDADRNVWRYDIGGYAWDNSELSTDLWLWYHYLRTGDAAAFRFVEAMCRHTGEVDQYHIGDWAGLGTRHGVLHWGDSAKQVRISNANYRRMYYFLTGDERSGDLLHSLIDSDRTFLLLDPNRKVNPKDYEPSPTAVPVTTTTDWGALAGAWLIEWERGGDEIAKTKLVNGLTSIAALPNGWAQGGEITYNLEDGTFTGPSEKAVSVGSLSSVFGLIEVMTEAVELVDDDAVREKWIEFCRLYNASRDEQIAASGEHWGSLNLKQSYSRASAYASVQLDDPVLAERAWKEFKRGHAGYPDDMSFESERIEPPRVLNAVDRAPFSTNASAQYGLAAIQCLALIGDSAS